jgi:kinesin family protein 3/17
MMAMISPALEALQESLSTLKFANRAKNIKNEAKINEDFDQKSLLRKWVSFSSFAVMWSNIACRGLKSFMNGTIYVHVSPNLFTCGITLPEFCRYERELKQLRAELEERSRNVVDKRRLLELDEQRRRAEADKMNAIL